MKKSDTICLLLFLLFAVGFVFLFCFVFVFVVNRCLYTKFCACEDHDVALAVAVKEGESVCDSEWEIGALVTDHYSNDFHFATGND